MLRVISPPADRRRFIIHEYYVGICYDAPNLYCAAAILGIMEYWTNTKVEAALSKNKAATQNDLWIYKTVKQLMELDFFGLIGDGSIFGRNAISDNFNWLTDQGYLDSRPNPVVAIDKTKQYLFKTAVVQEAIDDWHHSNDTIAERFDASIGKSKRPKKPKLKALGSPKTDPYERKDPASLTKLERLIMSKSNAKTVTIVQSEKLKKDLEAWDPAEEQIIVECQLDTLYEHDPYFERWLKRVVFPGLQATRSNKQGQLGRDLIISAISDLTSYYKWRHPEAAKDKVEEAMSIQDQAFIESIVGGKDESNTE